MRLYIDGTTTVIHAAPDQAAAPPDGTTAALALDEETNAALAADLVAAPWRYRVSGGQLLRDGATVPLAAAGTAYTERADMLATGQTALANLTAYLGLATPTAAQTTQAVQLLCRIARFLLRRALAS